MIKPLKTTLSQVLPWQADILQPILADYSHLAVTQLNDDNADWQQPIVSFIGTEVGWLQDCINPCLSINFLKTDVCREGKHMTATTPLKWKERIR